MREVQISMQEVQISMQEIQISMQEVQISMQEGIGKAGEGTNGVNSADLLLLR